MMMTTVVAAAGPTLLSTASPSFQAGASAQSSPAHSAATAPTLVSPEDRVSPSCRGEALCISTGGDQFRRRHGGQEAGSRAVHGRFPLTR